MTDKPFNPLAAMKHDGHTLTAYLDGTEKPDYRRVDALDPSGRPPTAYELAALKNHGPHLRKTRRKAGKGLADASGRLEAAGSPEPSPKS